MPQESPAGATDTVLSSDSPYGRIARGDVVSDFDISAKELGQILDLTESVKGDPRGFAAALRGVYISLLFEKPSLRTRITFELAIKQLGGDCVLSTSPVGEREPLKDVARNLERWTQALVIRTFEQAKVEALAQWARIPVINALSDMYHPCQALADVFTIREHFGRTDGLTVAFVGDGNNVAHSLMLTAVRCGMHVKVATPTGYEPSSEILDAARDLAKPMGLTISCTNEAREAVRGADVVYTDVWTSMGQEQEAHRRSRAFLPFQVNSALMAQAAPHAVFMHCLPAKRDEEVTDDVIESLQSIVFDQAENRLHTQKALLLMLLA